LMSAIFKRFETNHAALVVQKNLSFNFLDIPKLTSQ